MQGRSMMRFNELIGLLSKSSPAAVSTNNIGIEIERTLKEYLYVKTEIEKVFLNALNRASGQGEILFLCGSSGDGKSELLLRHQKRFKEKFKFHLDATHAFHPRQTAIQALDALFSEFRLNQQSLVICINIGMLANYVVDGAPENESIKEAIECFIKGLEDKNNKIQFIHFDDYPKFTFNDDGIASEFITSLLTKITAEDATNPFFQSLSIEPKELSLEWSRKNYQLLKLPEVHQKIVQLLLKIRLKFDQFLTARMMLDFIHHIIARSDSLVNNLYDESDNDLTLQSAFFDPASIRALKIDTFLITACANVEIPEFAAFQKAVADTFAVHELSPKGWLRLFYLLQDIELGNNYHHQFRDEFRQNLFENYVQLWLLHQNFDNAIHQKELLRQFYSDELTGAIYKFANRFEPSLSNDHHIDLGNYNGYRMAVKAELRPNFKLIQQRHKIRLCHFDAHLRMEDRDKKPIPITVPITVNFLELITKINQGYRPNKHDKNTIIILDEVIDEITRIARLNEEIKIIGVNPNDRWSLSHDREENEIVVGGY